MDSEKARELAHHATCSIFALPSISGPESCGLVVPEAMAAGKPAIASDLPGVKDNVEHGRTGLRVPPKDVDNEQRDSKRFVLIKILRFPRRKYNFGRK